MNGPTGTGWLLTYPQPAPLANLNQRKQWWEHQPIKTEWRDATYYHCRQAMNSRAIPGFLSGVALLFDFPVRSAKIRRDAHNYIPTVKACIDGMVTARLLIDDSTEHVTVLDPQFHNRRDDPNVIVHIRKRETP